MVWTVHYNGDGELKKCTVIAKSKFDQLHYCNEWIMSFERCTEIMTKCFNTLHKDRDQHYSDKQKVENLLKVIKCQDAELLVAEAIINQHQFPCNYVGVCRYFSSQVA